jgi:hypothetical protein
MYDKRLHDNLEQLGELFRRLSLVSFAGLWLGLILNKCNDGALWFCDVSTIVFTGLYVLILFRKP